MNDDTTTTKPQNASLDPQDDDSSTSPDNDTDAYASDRFGLEEDEDNVLDVSELI